MAELGLAKLMRLLNTFIVTALVCLISLTAPAATSDWISAPKPWLQPRSVRKKGQASVKVRLMIAKDGHVTEPTIVKPSDLTEGRVVEFLVR